MLDNYLNDETIKLFLSNAKANWIVLVSAIVVLAGTNVVYAETSNQTHGPEETSVEHTELDEESTEQTDSNIALDKENSTSIKEEKETDSSDDEENETQDETTEPFIMPAEGRVSSEYGYRIHPVYKIEKFHAGIDIAGEGPIVAVQDGTVTKVAYDNGWGWHVKIEHENDTETLYAHLKTDSLTIEKGDSVDQGQEIGTMGTTGTSTGVHLHFEVHIEGEHVDPIEHLDI